ncbi:MAG: D-alanyl-D-alanine carboxypeptidase/D-alanyl-D-alanine-endopeptidase [Pseudomonadota bacterium]
MMPAVFSRIFCVLLLALIVAPTGLGAATPGSLTAMAGNGTVMLRSPRGEDLVRINPERPLIPASLVKIPMAQVALDTLGESFRFETHFYRNAQGDLLIRGLGDPFLVSEELTLIAAALAERGVRHIRRLVVDDSAFEPDPPLPYESDTLQPYGARNSALAVNFNTVNLAWRPDGTPVSGEPQTPLTPLARELAGELAPGGERRINLGDDPTTALQQVQQLFRYFLEEAGIAVSDHDFHREMVTADWELFYRHRSSKSLRDNLEGLLHYSNNFIANQLFLTLGGQQHGYPATVEAARAVLVERLRALYGAGYGERPGALRMTEGSGLSREQRSSGSGMMHILNVFRPHAGLLDEVDGVRRKSGTLTGVYNFAGYITGPDGLYPFVIMTNQTANRRARILRELQSRAVP